MTMRMIKIKNLACYALINGILTGVLFCGPVRIAEIEDQKNGILTVEKINIEFMHLDKNWKLAMESENGAVENYTKKNGLIEINSSLECADKSILRLHRKIKSIENGFDCSIKITSSSGIESKRMGLALHLPPEEYAGRQIRIDNEDFQIPEQTGNPNLLLRAGVSCICLPLAQGVLEITGSWDIVLSDGRKWNLPISLILRARPDSGIIKESSIAAHIITAAVSSVKDEDIIIDGAQWFIYQGFRPETARGTDLDMSRLLDAPAGKHGTAMAKGEKIIFADETPARFWGINLKEENLFPDNAQADAMADFLSRIGVNLVRLHRIDTSSKGAQSIFGLAPCKSTRLLDPAALDRFEYLWAALKKKGIYLYFDLTTGRVIGEQDGVNPALIGKQFSIREHFFPELIDLQKEFAAQILTHKNPYTGTTLARDPALVMVEIKNEDSLFEMNSGLKPFVYGKDNDFEYRFLQKLFNEWVSRMVPDRAALEARWKDPAGSKRGLDKTEDALQGTIEFPLDIKRLFAGTREDQALMIDQVQKQTETVTGEDYSRARLGDVYRFLYETQCAYYKTMHEYLRSIGLKCLVAGSSHWISDPADLRANAGLDFIDRHNYWAHPKGGWAIEQITFEDRSMLSDPLGGIVGICGRRRVYGRPYIIGEWNFGFPNQYTAEGNVIMSAYASLQGWHGLQFNMVNCVSYPVKAMWGTFSVERNPVQLALWPATALLFARSDVTEAKTGYMQMISNSQAVDPFFNYDNDELAGITLYAKTGLMFDDIAVNPALSDRSILSSLKKTGPVVSVTGELSWDAEKSLFTMNTPRSCGFAGNTEGRELVFSSARVKTQNAFAVILLVSLTDDPVISSKKILLTAVSRFRNTGMEYSTDGKKIISKGDLPVLIEGVSAVISLKGGKAAAIYSLDHSGKPGTPVDYQYTNEETIFKIGAPYRAMHYVIKR